MTSHDVRLPSERFFFAALDTAALDSPRAKRDPTRLGYLFESTLPLPIEAVHAVYVPAGPDRVLACGMPTDALREAAAGALTLGPSGLPGFVQDLGVNPDAINLLTGVFEPRPVKRARRSLMVHAAAALVLCTALLALGMERRARVHLQQAAATHNAVETVYQAVLPPQTGRARPDAVRLTTELRRLRQTRSNRAGPVFDAADQLAALLAFWPDDLTLQTTSLTVTEPRSTVVATTANPDDAQVLINALAVAPGQRVHDSRAARSRDGTEVRLTLEPTPISEPIP